MSTEDGRQPLMMITTLNQLEEIQERCGGATLYFGPAGWFASTEVPGRGRVSSEPAHPDLGVAVQRLYLDVFEQAGNTAESQIL